MPLVKLDILAGPRLLPESSGIHRLCLYSTDEKAQDPVNDPFELRPHHLESLAIALNWVQYGLPHQAIV